jgi:tRNA U34 5-carboxymethylaminomethyl modifying GTPase MnmE/TrmE
MGPSDDTIAAIATSLGTGGIGIIKISGPKSVEIATCIFRPRNVSLPFKSYYLTTETLSTPTKDTPLTRFSSLSWPNLAVTQERM